MMDRVGQQLGNYRLVRLLGRGGFAEVYLGEHVHLKTFAGVKVLQAQLTTAQALEDFRREGQNIARLVHPYIIRVLDFGIEQDVPFLVMEYAPNGTLRQRYVKHVPLPVPQVVAYANQVASALQYAHDQRLIHRDVKPENMLLSATGTILLSDFGIATVARTSRSLSTQDISGTVAYMAPEQLQGKVGIASDQYALAMVVYEWLSGQLPFSGSFAEVASQHMFVQPPSLRDIVPGISPELERVVMTGLAKAPAERFARIEAFARALEAVSSDDAPTHFTPFPQVGGQISQLPQPVLPADAPTYMTPFPPPSSPASQPSQAVSGSDDPTYLTPRSQPGRVESQGPQRVMPAIAADFSRTVQATPVPETLWAGGATPVPQTLTPNLITPHPDAVMPLLPGAGGGSQAMPGEIGVVQPAPRKYSRRALLVGIAGATVVAVTLGAGASYLLFARRSPQVFTTPTPAPSTRTPATKAVTPEPSQPTTVPTTVAVGQVLNTYTGSHYAVGCAAWSPNGQSIASSALNVQVWDALKGTNVVNCNGHDGPVEAVAWSPDGRSLVSGGDDKTVRTWNAATGAPQLTLAGHTGPVWTVAWSPDGNYLVSGSGDNQAGVWNAVQGTNLFFYRGHNNTVYAVSFSADSQKIASASYDNTVQVWRSTDGTNLFTYTGHSSHVLAVAWAPAGASNTGYIASGSHDTTVQVWDMNNNGNRVTRYTQHASTVNALSWSPNGRAIASGDMNGQVLVWDVASGQTLYAYTRHTRSINWLAWSPDGNYLASASKDQTVQIWQAPHV